MRGLVLPCDFGAVPAGQHSGQFIGFLSELRHFIIREGFSKLVMVAAHLIANCRHVLDLEERRIGLNRCGVSFVLQLHLLEKFCARSSEIVERIEVVSITR